MRSPEVEITSGVFEILLRIAAGAGPGFIAAYMFHLALHTKVVAFCRGFVQAN
jgi:hypothetical protein